MKIFALLCLVVICAQARVGKVCQEQSACDEGECCQKLSLYPVVSKRQLAQVLPLKAEATCQLYKKLNDGCSSFEKVNGYCGCGPGLQCHGFEIPINDTTTSSPPVRRSIIAPRPGYVWNFRCAPEGT